MREGDRQEGGEGEREDAINVDDDTPWWIESLLLNGNTNCQERRGQSRSLSHTSRRTFFCFLLRSRHLMKD